MAARDAGAALLEALRSRGWQAEAAPACLDDVRLALEELRSQGLVDERLDADYLASFAFDELWEGPTEAALVVVAVPAFLGELVFRRSGEGHVVHVPPTYVGYERVKREVEAAARQALAPFGHRAVRVRVPEKTVATRVGLGRYGRNNICYVPGRGSFVELVALLADVPVGLPAAASSEALASAPTAWREPEMLERCATCTACAKACPTGAIGEDRFLLHAERCLTLFNERAEDLPDWIPADAHNALVGCLRCQAVCPEDRAVLWEVCGLGTFTEEETGLFLAQTPFSDLPPDTAARVEALELLVDYGVWTRNLRLLLDGRQAGVGGVLP